MMYNFIEQLLKFHNVHMWDKILFPWDYRGSLYTNKVGQLKHFIVNT